MFTIRGIPQHIADEARRTRRALPLAFEARATGSRDVGWLHVRHADAGCFIARVDRAA